MGRPRKQELPPEEEAPERPPEPDELEQAIADLPRDFSVITLYRIPDQGKPRYVTKLTPDEFDLEQIKRQYGGGRFRYVAIQEGIQVQKGHFEIEGEPVLPGRREEASPVSRDLAAFGDKLDRLADSLTARPAPSEDKDKLMAVLMAKLLEQKEDGEDAMLRKLSAYKAILGGGESSNFTMILEAIKQGMLLSGEGVGASPWVYIMDKLAPSVEKIAGALSTRGEPEKKPLAPAPALQVSDAFRPFMPLLKPYLPALIASASVNASAESWADIIEDNVPEQDFASMQTWLRGETWFKDLGALDRRIMLQAAWWQTLRNLLLEPPEGEEPGGPELGGEEPEAPEAA